MKNVYALIKEIRNKVVAYVSVNPKPPKTQFSSYSHNHWPGSQWIAPPSKGHRPTWTVEKFRRPSKPYRRRASADLIPTKNHKCLTHNQNPKWVSNWKTQKVGNQWSNSAISKKVPYQPLKIPRRAKPQNRHWHSFQKEANFRSTGKNASDAAPPPLLLYKLK